MARGMGGLGVWVLGVEVGFAGGGRHDGGEGEWRRGLG